MKYSPERRESVLRKLLPPQSRSVSSVSEEENISMATLFAWRNAARAEGRVMPKSDKSVKGWSSDEKFAVVLETAALNETQLAEYCRKQGLFPEQVNDWRELCRQANSGGTRAQLRRNQSDARTDKQQIRQLTKELEYKEKALAETAALLVMRKKMHAIWGKGKDE